MPEPSVMGWSLEFIQTLIASYRSQSEGTMMKLLESNAPYSVIENVYRGMTWNDLGLLRVNRKCSSTVERN